MLLTKTLFPQTKLRLDFLRHYDDDLAYHGPDLPDDEIFLSGLAFMVPASGLSGGINPVVWTGTFSSNTPGVSVHWKWGAAVYTSFSTDYNSLAVKAAHTNTCAFNNSDHAGTPENFKSSVVGGARGGGGSNFTGSWSGTASANVCQ